MTPADWKRGGKRRDSSRLLPLSMAIFRSDILPHTVSLCRVRFFLKNCGGTIDKRRFFRYNGVVYFIR